MPLSPLDIAWLMLRTSSSAGLGGELFGPWGTGRAGVGTAANPLVSFLEPSGFCPSGARAIGCLGLTARAATVTLFDFNGFCSGAACSRIIQSHT